MKVGIISGTGAYDWPGLEEPERRAVGTVWGPVEVTCGRVAGTEVVHLSRHGTGHTRLSNHVAHRANLAALRSLDVEALVSLTACGSLDRALAPGTLVVFDDLHFPSNRLPDGTLCTWYDQAGTAGRGHWIFDRPFCEPLRLALVAAAAGAGVVAVGSGCYGHVDGPRFNSRTEIAALAASGVTAVSQTAGPEVVLAGEIELPMALVGYVTDFANGVAETLAPVDELLGHIARSAAVMARVLEGALPALSGLPAPAAAGTVYRFDT